VRKGGHPVEEIWTDITNEEIRHLRGDVKVSAREKHVTLSGGDGVLVASFPWLGRRGEKVCWWAKKENDPYRRAVVLSWLARSPELDRVSNGQETRLVTEMC